VYLMGVPTSEVGYSSATTGRVDHKVHKGHVVAFGGENILQTGIKYSGILKYETCFTLKFN
jgi:hypothetical protein